MPVILRITLTKAPSDPWFIVSRKYGHEFFTQQELDDVLLPAWAITSQLLDDPNRPCVDNIVGDVYVSEQTFETQAKAEAFINFVKTSTDPVLVARRALLRQKLSNAGAQPYVSQVELIPIP